MVLEYCCLLSYHVPPLLIHVKHAEQFLAQGKHLLNICYPAVVAAAPATLTATIVTTTTATGSEFSKLLGGKYRIFSNTTKQQNNPPLKSRDLN